MYQSSSVTQIKSNFLTNQYAPILHLPDRIRSNGQLRALYPVQEQKFMARLYRGFHCSEYFDRTQHCNLDTNYFKTIQNPKSMRQVYGNDAAFPNTWEEEVGDRGFKCPMVNSGMDIRTYMATKLAAGYMARSNNVQTPETIVKFAVTCADALIAELNKPLQNPVL